MHQRSSSSSHVLQREQFQRPAEQRWAPAQLSACPQTHFQLGPDYRLRLVERQQ